MNGKKIWVILYKLASNSGGDTKTNQNQEDPEFLYHQKKHFHHLNVKEHDIQQLRIHLQENIELQVINVYKLNVKNRFYIN